MLAPRYFTSLYFAYQIEQDWKLVVCVFVLEGASFEGDRELFTTHSEKPFSLVLVVLLFVRSCTDAIVFVSLFRRVCVCFAALLETTVVRLQWKTLFLGKNLWPNSMVGLGAAVEFFTNDTNTDAAIRGENRYHPHVIMETLHAHSHSERRLRMCTHAHTQSQLCLICARIQSTWTQHSSRQQEQ